MVNILMFGKMANLKMKCGNRTELVKKSYKVMETNVWEKSTIKNSKRRTYINSNSVIAVSAFWH